MKILQLLKKMSTNFTKKLGYQRLTREAEIRLL